MEILDLKNVTLFSALTDDELKEIGDKISLRNFKKNEVILHEEDTSELMYLIIAGKVKVVQISADGKETILALHKSGDFFGEMSLIDGKTAPATVVATENSRIAFISKKDFFSLITMQKKLFWQLLQIFCARLREAFERIQILSFSNASQRIKMLLVMLAETYGKKTEKGIRLDIKLTHQNIADMTGITRETVTRIINKAQREGDITLKNKIIYLNPDFIKREFRH